LLNIQLFGGPEKLNIQQRPREEVTLYEVGPRDGLQNEPEILSSDAKVALVTRLVDAGVRRIEVTSFVSPKWIAQLADGDDVARRVPRIEVTSFVSPEWIPQLADGDDVARRVPRREGVRYSALVPNMKGYQRFRASGLPAAALFVSASESHNRKNVNRSIRDHLDRLRPVAARAKGDGIWLRAYLSTVCGCPYEGEVAVDEVSLGDTIGVGTPDQVQSLMEAVAEVAPLEKLALHMHDTGGTRRLSLRSRRLGERGNRGPGGSLRSLGNRHWDRSGRARGDSGLGGAGSPAAFASGPSVSCAPRCEGPRVGGA
jgi:hydroxymethylglutaryl-CoA lyase